MHTEALVHFRTAAAATLLHLIYSSNILCSICASASACTVCSDFIGFCDADLETALGKCGGSSSQHVAVMMDRKWLMTISRMFAYLMVVFGLETHSNVYIPALLRKRRVCFPFWRVPEKRGREEKKQNTMFKNPQEQNSQQD